MSSLAARASGRDAGEVAVEAGVPREAVELAWASEIVDLHLETFIPPRLWGYDLHVEHTPRGPFGGWFFGHLDLPRVLAGGLTGAMWSIATNIAQPSSRRFAVLEANLEALRASLEKSPHVEVVRDHRGYVAAREAGKHAALLTVQGGNAYQGSPDGVRAIADRSVVRVTVVHLSNSLFGATSSPLRLGRDTGLSDAGRDFVRALNGERIFVDLAHVSERGFWDAVEVHDRSQPLIVTHTGIQEVHRCWRNIDQKQVRAVADTGGVVGIIFQGSFLGPMGDRGGRRVIDHLDAVIRYGGEDAAAIGSDYDGAIIPPPELQNGKHAYYRLVAWMLERGWKDTRIQRVLGRSFLASFARLRP